MSQSHAFTIHYGGNTSRLSMNCGITPEGKAKDMVDVYGKHVAIWDTGITFSTISKRIVQYYGLSPEKGGIVKHIGGASEYNLYYVDLLFPDGIAIPSVKVMDGHLDNFDLLIGMDIIRLGNLAISNLNGETTLSFRIPSNGIINFANNKKPWWRKLIGVPH